MHGHEATQEAASTRAEESQMHQIRLCFEGVNDETYEVTAGNNPFLPGNAPYQRAVQRMLQEELDCPSNLTKVTVEETVSSLNAQEGGSA